MHAPSSTQKWYSGISTYQWLVLLIASLGWIFDVFEGQVFVASMDELAKELLGPSATVGERAYYNNISMGMFLFGGAIGGVAFGVLSDRIGRARTMILTILMYSLFTCLTAFAQEWWHVAILRFLVALGVGGEWAVASAMVAEHFPARARAWSGAIFHASSVFGTFLAILVGEFVVANPNLGWRWAFALGAIPALLTLWIRWQIRDGKPPADRESTSPTRAAPLPSPSTPVSRPRGTLGELFSGRYLRRVILGVSLATVGLATFWGVHIYGKDVLRAAEVRAMLADGQEIESPVAVRHLKRVQMTGMLLTTIGGGLGLLAFGPLCAKLGRRPAFVLFHLGGCAMGLVVFAGMVNASLVALAWVLPVFGFMTLGMHAGYAIYFPELFPARIRGAGAGFCFNVARILAAPVLFGNGWVQKEYGITAFQAAAGLSLLFLLGLIVVAFAPETKDTELE